MNKKTYRMIGLPDDLYRRCEEIVKSGRYGYSSVSELVKDGTRRRLEELWKILSYKREGETVESIKSTTHVS